MKQQRHADVLVFPEGVSEAEERARRKTETGEVVVRRRGEAEFAGRNLRGREDRDRHQKKSGQEAGSLVQQVERSAHRRRDYLAWNALRISSPSAPAFFAHSSAICLPIVSNSAVSFAEGFMILIPCEAMVFT